MVDKPLASKRALVLGAETPVGHAIAGALAEAGARFALVAATADAETAFAVQRLARRSGATLSQAIEATNEMAVRVMVRQVSKALGGLDAVVFCAELGERTEEAHQIAWECSTREFVRSKGDGKFIGAMRVFKAEEDAEALARQVVEALAAEPP